MIEHQPDHHDDTSDDYEQFERRQLAHDRDRREPPTTDLDGAAVRTLVEDLIDQGMVDIDGENRRLIHCPSGQGFKSRAALAHFHLGWVAATDERSE